MTTFLLRRLLYALAVITLSTSLGFVVLHVLPGDPLGRGTGQAAQSSRAIALQRARLHLDQPIAEQYVLYVSRTLSGDWGVSDKTSQPVGATLRTALANSLLLSGTGLVLAVLLGLAVGAFQGWHARARSARLLGSALTVLYVLPEFIIGIALIALLAVQWKLFPIGGPTSAFADASDPALQQLRDRAWHLVLPSLTLAVGWGAAVARQQRVALSEVRGEDFVRTARAKGLSEFAVFGRHAWRASLPGVLVIIGLMLPVLVGGSVVVESVFRWPGVGTVLLNAVLERDYSLASGGIVLTGLIVSLGTVLTDLAVVTLDPRLRAEAR